MRRIHRLDVALTGGAAILITACTGPRGSELPSTTSDATTADLYQAITGPQRGEQEKARDAYRHPFETLTFFGVRSDMTVVELWPGRGWYTAILAPYLRARGTLIVASGDPNGDPKAEPTEDGAAFLARRQTQPDVFDHVTTVVVPRDSEIELGPPESADAVVTFRNLHTFVWLQMDQRMLTAAFRVLRHGGVLGMTDHRAAPGSTTDPKVVGETGYIPEPYAIQRVEAAGFKLVARSEVNANPKDTKDYEGGVWALPPTYANGEKDHARYEAIGESDRMTLKFVKP